MNLATTICCLQQKILAGDERFLARLLHGWTEDAQDFARYKLHHVLLVCLIAFLLSWLLRSITHHMVVIAERHAPSPQRLGQVKTMAGVIRTSGTGVIVFISGLGILAAMVLNLVPLLASAGAAGIAIGLAAQNIVRAVFSGMLILVEDQFNVGDVVTVAGLTGTVESMTLRKTCLRLANGAASVISNSQITTVQNQSARNSISTVNVSVDYSADPDAVASLLCALAMGLRQGEEFGGIFTADPEVLGLDDLKGSEMIFAVLFKTRPNQQYAMLREFRRRVRLAFEEHRLLPGDPQRPFREYGEKPRQPDLPA
jgi:small conductance mechanosensitive channel